MTKQSLINLQISRNKSTKLHQSSNIQYTIEQMLNKSTFEQMNKSTNLHQFLYMTKKIKYDKKKFKYCKINQQNF